MVETDIITSIAVSQKGLPTTLVIIYVKTFKTDAIVFIDNDIICVTSHWTMISSITVSSLILTISLSEIKGSDITLNDDFQYHSQFVVTDNIALWDQRKWHHIERWFPVSQSVYWYWQYRSVRSKEVTSHWTMICSITVSLLILTISLSEIKGSDVTLNDDLQYHSQLVDTDSIAQWDQRIAQWDQRKTSEIKGKPVRSKDRSVRSKENYPNEQ
jgi:hypothetical protein